MLYPLDAIVYGMSDCFNGLHTKCVSDSFLAQGATITYVCMSCRVSVPHLFAGRSDGLDFFCTVLHCFDGVCLAGNTASNHDLDDCKRAFSDSEYRLNYSR